MRIHKINQWGEGLLWLLNPLLIILAFFNETTKINHGLEWLGKLHPLLLHFPIVLGVAIVVYLIFLPNKKLDLPLERLLFTSNAVLATLVALFGIFLSKQDAYDKTIVDLHKWGGVAIALSLIHI